MFRDRGGVTGVHLSSVRESIIFKGAEEEAQVLSTVVLSMAGPAFRDGGVSSRTVHEGTGGGIGRKAAVPLPPGECSPRSCRVVCQLMQGKGPAQSGRGGLKARKDGGLTSSLTLALLSSEVVGVEVRPSERRGGGRETLLTSG